MARKKSPDITIFIPPTQDRPTVAARRITVSELDDDCARSVVQDILNKTMSSKHEWTFDFFTTPVRLEIHRGGKLEKVFEWPTSDFPCLSDFLDDLRLRLRKLFRVELPKISKAEIQAIVEQARVACCDETIEIIEIDRVPSEADLAIERIRTTLGLEGLKQPSRRVSRLARLDKRRVPRAERGITELSRQILKISEVLEVLR